MGEEVAVFRTFLFRPELRQRPFQNYSVAGVVQEAHRVEFVEVDGHLLDPPIFDGR